MNRENKFDMSSFFAQTEIVLHEHMQAIAPACAKP